MPCTWLTWVLFLALNMVPPFPLDILPELNTKPIINAECHQVRHKKKDNGKRERDKRDPRGKTMNKF